MIIKYWAGTITPALIQTTSTGTWARAWLNKAQKAENAGNELIVLEVPKNELIGAVVAIEESIELYLKLDIG